MFKKLKDIIKKAGDLILKYPKLIVLIVLVLFAVWIFISVESLHITSEPGFCEFCHPQKKTGPLSEVHTWRNNIHAARDVKCLDCHGSPGFIGYMKAKIAGLRDIYGFVVYSREDMLEILTRGATDPFYAAKLVPNEICLFCHSDSYNQKIRKERVMSVGVKFRKLDGVKNPEFRKSVGLKDILSEPITGDIEPNHKKHIDAGVACVECHLGVAHGGEYKNKVNLERCNECHEKRQAAINMSDIRIGGADKAVTFSHKSHTAMFKCTECHAKLFLMRKGVTKITFADHQKSKLCYSCHNDKIASYECSRCHAVVSAPKAPITYRVAGMPPVKFSHEFHAAAFKCSECHTKIWPMKKGVKKMKMDDMYQGKLCGTCHNGKTAFESTQCESCHGTAIDHPEKPQKLSIDKTRQFCLRCHASLPYRPALYTELSKESVRLKMIDDDNHNP